MPAEEFFVYQEAFDHNSEYDFRRLMGICAFLLLLTGIVPAVGLAAFLLGKLWYTREQL